MMNEELIEKLKVERQKLFEMIQKVADELYGWVMSENEISEFLHILDEAHIRLLGK